MSYALYSLVNGLWIRVSDFYQSEKEAHSYAATLKLYHHSGRVYYNGTGHLFMVEER